MKISLSYCSHTRSSPQANILQILDNHAPHMSLEGIYFCKRHGIALLSFPSHCSHKLQPLDCSVSCLLKKYFNHFQDKWMKTHSGHTMSIYDLPGIVKDALPLATTTTNAQVGFRCSVNWPLNRDIFSNQEYVPSRVTFHPCPPQPSTSSSESTPLPKAPLPHAPPSHGHDTQPTST